MQAQINNIFMFKAHFYTDVTNPLRVTRLYDLEINPLFLLRDY